MPRRQAASCAGSRWLRWATAVFAAVASLSLPGAAEASGATFALRVTNSSAPYFVLAGRPGMVLTGDVTVINVGAAPARVSLYATDATTGQTSGAVYRSRQEPRVDVGAWIRLSQSRLALDGGHAAVVPFRVFIPQGARGGQHLGGIVAEPDQAITQFAKRRGKATFHVRVRSIAVIAAEVNLPGPRTQRLAITGIHAGGEPGYQTLLIGLASTGTALTRGTGTISVTDDSGRHRVDQWFSLDTFVPRTRINFPVQVQGSALLAGSYKATVSITSDGRRLTRVMPLLISQRNLAQAFGSRHTTAPNAPAQSTVPFIIGGLMVLLLGFTLGARARTRRPAER